MALRAITLILLLFSTPLTASNWVNDWYENVYEQRIAPQQQQQLADENLTQCEQKLRLYRDKVNEDPNSDYYQYKLEDWTRKCK